MVLTVVQVICDDVNGGNCDLPSDLCQEISAFLVDFSCLTLSQLVLHGNLPLFQFVVKNDCQQLLRYKRCFGRQEIMDALAQACQESNFQFVVQLTNLFGASMRHLLANQHRALALACAQGNLDIVQFLMKSYVGMGTNSGRGPGLGTGAATAALSNGGAQPMDLAAQNGHLHLVKFLHRLFPWKDACCSRLSMDFASENGFLHVVKFLHQHRSEGCTKRAMDLACQNGFLHVVQFLHEHRSEGYTSEGPKQACANGYLRVIKFFVANRMSFCVWCCMQAALEQGHLLVAKWLDQERDKQQQLQQASMYPATNANAGSALSKSSSSSSSAWHDASEETKPKAHGTSSRKPFGCMSSPLCDEFHVLKKKTRERAEKLNKGSECRRFYRSVAQKGGLDALKWIHQRFGRGGQGGDCSENASSTTKNSTTDIQNSSNSSNDANHDHNYHSTPSKHQKKHNKKVFLPNMVKPHENEPVHANKLMFGSEVWEVCVEEGNVGLAKWLLEEIRLPLTSDNPQEVARKGHLDLLRVILASQPTLLLAPRTSNPRYRHNSVNTSHDRASRLPRLLEIAAANGQVEVCRFLMLERGFRLTRLDPVVVHGKLSLLQCVYDHQKDAFAMTCSQAAADSAASNGHLEVVQFLYDKRLQRCSTSALMAASEEGIEEIVVFLLEHEKEQVMQPNGHEDLWQALEKAIAHGQFPVVELLVRFIREHGGNNTSTCSMDAARLQKTGLKQPAKSSGGLPSLQAVGGRLLHAINDAASRNHFQVMRLMLRETAITTGVRLVIEHAVMRGNLQTIRFLHDHGVQEFSPQDMDEAAARGFFAIVEFLHCNRHEGCTPRAMDAAACHGFLGIVEFLHQNRHEGCTFDAMDGAAYNGHLRVVRFLHENRQEGCSYAAMDDAARFGDLEMVNFLHLQRREGCTPRAMDLAAANGYLDVVKFLHFHRNEGCTPAALVFAAENGHYEVVKWLLMNRVERDLDQAIQMASSKSIRRLLERVLEGKPFNRSRPPPPNAAVRGQQQQHQHRRFRNGSHDHNQPTRPHSQPAPLSPRAAPTSLSGQPKFTHICFPDAA